MGSKKLKRGDVAYIVGAPGAESVVVPRDQKARRHPEEMLEALGTFFGPGVDVDAIVSGIVADDLKDSRSPLRSVVAEGVLSKLEGILEKKIQEKVSLPFRGTAMGMRALADLFPAFNFDEGNKQSGHPDAANIAVAMRHYVMLTLIGAPAAKFAADSKFKPNFLVKSPGGKLHQHFKMGSYSVHSCNPILDEEDQNRLSHNELMKSANRDYRIWCKNNPSAQCYKKAEQCNIIAKYMIFEFSQFDMTTNQVAAAMASAKSTVGYSWFWFPRVLLTMDVALWVGMHGEIEAAKLMWVLEKEDGQWMVQYNFVDGTKGYRHRLQDQKDAVIRRQISYDGIFFHVEVLNHKHDLFLLKIVRNNAPPVGARDIRTAWDRSLPQKCQKIVLPLVENHQDYRQVTYMDYTYTKNIHKGFRRQFWDKSTGLEPCTIIVSKKLLDMGLRTGMQLKDGNFLPSGIFTFVSAFASTLFTVAGVSRENFSHVPTETLMKISTICWQMCYVDRDAQTQAAKAFGGKEQDFRKFCEKTVAQKGFGYCTGLLKEAITGIPMEYDTDGMTFLHSQGAKDVIAALQIGYRPKVREATATYCSAACRPGPDGGCPSYDMDPEVDNNQRIQQVVGYLSARIKADRAASENPDAPPSEEAMDRFLKDAIQNLPAMSSDECEDYVPVGNAAKGDCGYEVLRAVHGSLGFDVMDGDFLMSITDFKELLTQGLDKNMPKLCGGAEFTNYGVWKEVKFCVHDDGAPHYAGDMASTQKVHIRYTPKGSGHWELLVPSRMVTRNAGVATYSEEDVSEVVDKFKGDKNELPSPIIAESDSADEMKGHEIFGEAKVNFGGNVLVVGDRDGKLGRSATLVRPDRCVVVLPKNQEDVDMPTDYLVSYQDYEKVIEGLAERDFDLAVFDTGFGDAFPSSSVVLAVLRKQWEGVEPVIRVGSTVVLGIDRVDDPQVSEFLVEVINKFGSYGFLKPLNANQLTFEKFLFLYNYEGKEAVECAGVFTARKLVSISRHFASDLYPRWVAHLEEHNAPGMYRRAVNYLMGTRQEIVVEPVISDAAGQEETGLLVDLQEGGAIDDVDAIHSIDQYPSGDWPVEAAVVCTPPPDYQSPSEDGSQAPLIINEVLPEGVGSMFPRGELARAATTSWRQRLRKTCACSPCCGGECGSSSSLSDTPVIESGPKKVRFGALKKFFSREKKSPRVEPLVEAGLTVFDYLTTEVYSENEIEHRAFDKVLILALTKQGIKTLRGVELAKNSSKVNYSRMFLRRGLLSLAEKKVITEVATAGKDPFQLQWVRDFMGAIEPCPRDYRSDKQMLAEVTEMIDTEILYVTRDEKTKDTKLRAIGAAAYSLTREQMIHLLSQKETMKRAQGEGLRRGKFRRRRRTEMERDVLESDWVKKLVKHPKKLRPQTEDPRYITTGLNRPCDHKNYVTGALQPPVVRTAPFDGGAKNYEPVMVEDAYGERIKKVLLPALKRMEEGNFQVSGSDTSPVPSSSLDWVSANEDTVESVEESTGTITESVGSDGLNTGSEDSGSGQDLGELPGAHKPLDLNLKWNNHPVPRKLILRTKGRSPADEKMMREMLSSAGEFVEMHRAQVAVITNTCDKFMRADANTYARWKEVENKRQARQIENHNNESKMHLVEVTVVGTGATECKMVTSSITGKRFETMYIFDTKAEAIVTPSSCSTGHHLVHENMIIMPSMVHATLDRFMKNPPVTLIKTLRSGKAMKAKLGVPGCGKTTMLLNKARTGDWVLTPSKQAKEDVEKKAKSMKLDILVRTIDSFLMGAAFSKVAKGATIHVDEYLMVHAGALAWVKLLTGCEMFLYGDTKQNSYNEHFGQIKHMVRRHLAEPFVHVVSFKATSHRVPQDIVPKLEESYKDLCREWNEKVSSTSDVKFSMQRIDFETYDKTITAHENSKEEWYYMVYFTSEVNIIRGLLQRLPKYKKFTDEQWRTKVATIAGSQGRTETNVCLIRGNERKTAFLYDKESMHIVGLTRHTQRFNYVTHADDGVAKYIAAEAREGAGISLSVKEVETARMMPLWSLKNVSKEVTDHSIMTGFMSGPSFGRPAARFSPAYWNEGERPYRPATKEEIQIFYDILLPGVSVANVKMQKEIMKYLPITLGNFEGKINRTKGLVVEHTYDYMTPHIRTEIQPRKDQTQMETCHALAKRNTDVNQLETFVSPEAKSDAMVEAFFETFTKPFLREEIHITHSRTGVRDWLIGKGGEMPELIQFERQLGDMDITSFDFTIKPTTKPSGTTSCIHEYPAVQTIAAQSKQINALLCPIAKALKEKLLSVLKDNVMIYTDMAPQEVAKAMDIRFPYDYAKNIPHIETDISKYDKQQGLLALLTCKKIYIRLGCDPDIAEFIVKCNVAATLKGRKSGVEVFSGTQKRSGEAMTFFGNTIFCMAAHACGLRWANIVFAIFGGDDGAVWGQNLVRDDTENFFEVSFNLIVKVLHYQCVEFCSKWLVGAQGRWAFVPKFEKLLAKLGRHDVRDSIQLEEYRTSLIDLVGFNDHPAVYMAVSAAMQERTLNCNFDCSFILGNIVELIKSKAAFHGLWYFSKGARRLIDPSRAVLGGKPQFTAAPGFAILIPAMGGKTTIASMDKETYDVDIAYDKSGLFKLRKKEMTNASDAQDMAKERAIEIVKKEVTDQKILLCHDAATAEKAGLTILGAMIPSPTLWDELLGINTDDPYRREVSRENVASIEETSQNVFYFHDYDEQARALANLKEMRD
jgi:hypothetical protein